MTTVRPQSPIENVLGGGLLALLAIPVGVIILTLIASIGVFASIVGFIIAFSSVWLYRRGSGGIISRTGAWIVTAIVLVTLLLGIWVTEVVGFARGIGHLGNIGLPEFWPQFNHEFPSLLGQDALFIVLVLVFGAVGAFRTLGRAFATTRVITRPDTAYGSPDGPSSIGTTTYQNDVDGAPTGSIDDKTTPPTTGN